MGFPTVFFDLDDTLYPASSCLWKEIRKRISLSMHDRLGFSWEEIGTIQEEYFCEYGTTLRGLQVNHRVDAIDYLSFVHDVLVERYLHRNRKLHDVILGIQAQKYIFTNADVTHANRVLKTLGLEDCFTGVIDVLAIMPYCKPMQKAFEEALYLVGNSNPRECLLIDDQPCVTRIGRALGFNTILINFDKSHPDADFAIQKPEELLKNRVIG